MVRYNLLWGLNGSGISRIPGQCRSIRVIFAIYATRTILYDLREQREEKTTNRMTVEGISQGLFSFVIKYHFRLVTPNYYTAWFERDEGRIRKRKRHLQRTRIANKRDL